MMCGTFAVLVFATGAAADAVLLDVPELERIPAIREVKQVTQGPKHHFFGYYGISPWDVTGRYLVCLESEFGDRLVEADDVAGICLVDLETGETRRIAETRAWNFQQGALVHWLGTAPDREIIYNDRVDGALAAVVLDVKSGARRVLPRPLAAVSNDGRLAASISYARLRTTRPGYGYAGGVDPFAEEPHPAEDGLFIMDTQSGETKLIVSIRQAFEAEPVPEGLEDKTMWFNHVLFSRDDSRIMFLARVPKETGGRETAVFTVNPDGTDLRCELPYAWGGSHYDWLDGRRLMVTTRYQAQTPWRHVVWTDGEGGYTPLATEVLTWDGHGHFSPDGEWMVTDNYRDRGGYRSLFLLHMESGDFARLGRFREPQQYSGEWRCDLHPRWRQDGRALCIDSTHDGTRQVYIVELDWPGQP
jgi:hypothetical protein